MGDDRCATVHIQPSAEHNTTAFLQVEVRQAVSSFYENVH